MADPRILDIHILIENEANQCRILVDADLIEKIERTTITNFYADAGGNAWKVTLRKPVPLFDDYDVKSFYLDDLMHERFMRKWIHQIDYDPTAKLVF